MKYYGDLNPLMIEIGQKLKTLRNIKGEKIATIATNIGVSSPVISLVENGRYEGLSLRLLTILADYYNVTLVDLINSKCGVRDLVLSSVVK